MTELQTKLLALLTQCADDGGVCPSINNIKTALRMGNRDVVPALEALKRKGHISWKMHRRGNQWIGRTVTIAATGKTTAMPGRPSDPKRPAFTPIESGCRVRVLTGEEFLARKAELEARENAPGGRSSAAAP